jgi:tRNA nucleotidyltransferase/poly(A) polymerase
MRELAREILRGQEAWVVGGAVRDELLGREVIDLDVACADPKAAARAYARRSGGAPFPLSERHGAWRVALDGDRTVDFTPLREGIEQDLASRDFTINAVAIPLAGGEPLDPHGGLADLDARRLRAVSPAIFEDDPLRLLRAVRLEEELDTELDPETESLVRAHAALVTKPAGERILAELERLEPRGFFRLHELGLLEPLGGALERLAGVKLLNRPGFLLTAVFGRNLERLPISNDLRRYARKLLTAERPPDSSPRSIHHFRRRTEPWALDAVAFLGGDEELARAVEQARAEDPRRPLLRGDELGLPPGPEVGRLLDRIEEERAAGAIATREEALELVRRERDGR